MAEEFLHSFIPSKAVTPFFISLAGVTYPNPNYHMCKQNRDVTVIEYVTSGQGYVFFDGKHHKVGADTIYLLTEGDYHDYYADKHQPFTKIFLNISGTFAKEIATLYGLGGNHIFKNKKLRSCFERIVQILRSELSEEEMQIELQLLLAEIFTKLSYSVHRAKSSNEAVKLKDYIDANTDRILSGNELARLIFRSVDYCQKLFVKEYGLTPYAYQINRKIMIAKNLLLNTNVSIGEIGASLGYSDPHYFSNIFKSKTGLSPSNYRKAKTLYLQ